MQISCSNPFSILSSKKVRHEPPREKGKVHLKDTKPAQRTEAPKKNESKKAEAKKEEPPKKDAKVVTLTAEDQKALVKEQEKLDKEAKRERDRTDKQDRSGKAHQVRKEGKGVGGWDDNKVDAEVAQEVVAEEVDAEPKEEVKKEKEKSAEELAAETKAKEEEAKLRELEEKQMTLEEYQEKLKKENAPPTATFNVRTVDDSGFKGMVAKGKDKGDKKFQIGEKPKKAAPVKKEEKDKKEEKKEKVQVDVGFRMENPARQQGKGKGEGKGKGAGRGRGGYSSSPSKEEVAPPVDDEKAFPALGGASA